MSHVITLHGLPASNRYCHRFSHLNPRFMTMAVPARVATVFPKVKSQSSNSNSTAEIDFSDPDWKTKFKNDFEDRFRLPHVTDIFPDAASMPSTFCPNLRFVSLCFRRISPSCVRVFCTVLFSFQSRYGFLYRSFIRVRVSRN